MARKHVWISASEKCRHFTGAAGLRLSVLERWYRGSSDEFFLRFSIGSVVVIRLMKHLCARVCNYDRTAPELWKASIGSIPVVSELMRYRDSVIERPKLYRYHTAIA